MKTEMADKPKHKDTPKSETQSVAAVRLLAGFKAREANLKAKIERIPTFTAETRDQSMERAKTHLAEIQAEIKKAS